MVEYLYDPTAYPDLTAQQRDVLSSSDIERVDARRTSLESAFTTPEANFRPAGEARPNLAGKRHLDYGPHVWRGSCAGLTGIEAEHSKERCRWAG